jgi:glycosyltransferase involved in cell wall biosynthesis
MQDVLLTWRLGTNFGWGIYGLNLFAHWANDPQLRPLMGYPISYSDLNGTDPLRVSRIAAAAQASNEYLQRLGNPDPAQRIDAIRMDGLGNDFLARHPWSARLMIGRVIFETSATQLARERLARYDLLLSASSWNGSLLAAATGRQVQVIHEGVDESLFCPGPRSGWLDPRRFYVFSGGKIEFRKGQDLVVMGFRRFAERHPDAMLVTAWHSPTVEFARGFRGRLAVPLTVGSSGMLQVARWLAENGIDARQVLDLGLVPNALMPAVLREMHVALQPSRAEACTNLPVKEAMACGVPVIAARNTGMLDLLTADNSIPLRHQSPLARVDGTDTEGWGESDAEEIDAALEFAYQDRAHAASIGARGRAWLIQNGRTWRQHAAALKQWVLSHAP